jgi:hypothetical protein
MTRRRVILLLLCGLIAVGIAYEHALAGELDASCASLCDLGCAGEDGCLLFRQIGCNCSFICRSGVQGGTVCGGGG